MGASFRTAEQITALAGCDNLTIAPKLLEELSARHEPLTQELSPDTASGRRRVTYDEPEFRWEINSDAMATEKLAEGIRDFDTDHRKLVSIVAEHMA